MSEADRNGKTSHAGVKGEFVGKPVCLDGNQTSLEKETGPDGSETNPSGSGVNQKQGHCPYAPSEAIFVNSLKVIYVYIYLGQTQCSVVWSFFFVVTVLRDKEREKERYMLL